MALAQTFSVSEGVAGDSITVTDTTGAYAASTNEGGYGAPNTERADLALLIVAKQQITNDDDIYYSPAAYDPTSVTSWTFTAVPEEVYWVRFQIYNLPLKSDVGSPVEGDLAWDEIGAELEKYTSGAWVVVDSVDWNTELEASSEDYTIKDYGKTSGYSLLFNHLVNLRIFGCSSCEVSEISEYIKEVKEQKVAFNYWMCNGNQAKAQQIAENYKDRIVELLQLESA